MRMSDLAEPIKVLDHGYVRFINSMGTDETVIEAARMSTGKGFLGWDPARVCVVCGADAVLVQKLIELDGIEMHPCTKVGLSREHRFADTKGDESLLRFMYSHSHMTPFEFCVLHIEVQAPLFVFREWHRHRMQSYSEASARYTQMPNEHYVPSLDRFTPKQTGNKQADSARVQLPVDYEAFSPEMNLAMVKKEQADLYSSYESMLADGVPKEVARINTPVSRYSKMRATTDLRNWLQFLTLRDAPTAQWEIQQYARAVGQIIQALWPRTYALWEEHTKYAVTLSRSERELFTRWYAEENDTPLDKPDSEFGKLVSKIEDF